MHKENENIQTGKNLTKMSLEYRTKFPYTFGVGVYVYLIFYIV